MKKEVVIIMRGGVIESVMAKENMKVSILDWDSLENGEEDINEFTKLVEQKTKELKAIY